MTWRLKLVCQHNTVRMIRSHRDACKEHHGKEAWVDKHGVFNFFACAECKHVLKAAPSFETIYPAMDQK